MKKLNISFIVAFLLLSLTAAPAQEQRLDLKKVCERYEECLKTGHCEIITSTLIHLMKMYYQYPEHDYTRLVCALDTLSAVVNDTPVCTKILLAKKYLSGEKNLDWMMEFSYEEVYDFLRIWCAAVPEETAFDQLPLVF